MLDATRFLLLAVVIYGAAWSVLAVITERLSGGFLVVYVAASVLYGTTGWGLLSLETRAEIAVVLHRAIGHTPRG